MLAFEHTTTSARFTSISLSPEAFANRFVFANLKTSKRPAYFVLFGFGAGLVGAVDTEEDLGATFVSELGNL